MKYITKSSLVGAILGMYMVVSLVACSPSADELYDSARLAAQNQKFDQAIELYRQVKTAAPDQVEFAYKCLFGESEVYLKQKKLTKQLTLLEKMYSNASFEKFKPLVAEKLEENYLAQASQANLAENPEM